MRTPIGGAVAFALDNAPAACGVGRTNLDAAHGRGDLTYHYVGTKPVVLASDLAAWIESLPTEKPKR